MTRISDSRYVLAVKDLSKSVSYYIEKLGFKSDWQGDGWHFLSRDKVRMMLGECPDDRSAFETKNHSYFGYFDVIGIDQLFDEFNVAGVEIIAQLEDKPWGQREFGIRTIDGHRIMIGQEITSKAET